MIREILDATINEVAYSKFEITEFQLGADPMMMFVLQVKENLVQTDVDIARIKSYNGIRISEHPSKDAIMYCLRLRPVEPEKTES